MQPRGRWTRRTLIAAALAAAASPAMAMAAEEDLPWHLPPLRHTRVNGQQLAYFESGSGPTLVLVHGASGSPAMEFGRVFAPLARRFRVIAPYLLGYAPSDQPDAPYDAATFTDYLGGFLAAVNAEGAVLGGESLGGWVVGHYAVRQNAKSAWGDALPRISRLMILDGALQVQFGSGANGAQDSVNDPEVKRRTHEFYVAQPPVDNSKVAQSVGPHVLKDPVTDAQLQALKIPTLVLWGREDKLLPLAMGEHFAAQIPGARKVIIEHCGHIPSVERPHEFLAAVGTFLGVGSADFRA